MYIFPISLCWNLSGITLSRPLPHINSFAVCLLPHRLHPEACPNHNRCPGLTDKRTCKICKALNMCMFAANRFAFEQKTKTSVAETCSGSRLSRSAKAASDRCFSGCAFAKKPAGSKILAGSMSNRVKSLRSHHSPFLATSLASTCGKMSSPTISTCFPPTTESASLQKTFDQALQSMILAHRCNGLSANRAPTRSKRPLSKTRNKN